MISIKSVKRVVRCAAVTLFASAAVTGAGLPQIAAAAIPFESNSKDAVPAFSDLQGKRYTSSTLATHPATVFLFISSQCPISNVYSPRMNALEAVYGKQGVLVIGVYSDRQESTQAIALSAKQHNLSFPIVKDAGNSIADALHAAATPTAIAVDSRGRIVYSGRIDDNPVATHVTSHDLANALDDILHGRVVAKKPGSGHRMPHPPRCRASSCSSRHADICPGYRANSALEV
jgi:peroxiredoxin